MVFYACMSLPHLTQICWAVFPKVIYSNAKIDFAPIVSQGGGGRARGRNKKAQGHVHRLLRREMGQGYGLIQQCFMGRVCLCHKKRIAKKTG
jgi:hypothetical protein